VSSLLADSPRVIPTPQNTYEVTPEDYKNFGRGLLTAPFTAAPDVLGLLTSFDMFGNYVGPKISGDPIREAVGMDKNSTAGLLGEFLDPTGTVMKGAKLAVPAIGGLLGYMGVAANRGRNVPEIARFMRGGPAYHGTPHRFEVPSNEFMGTGEGAQAYGWGHYVAETPDVAKSYVPRDFDAEEVMMQRYKAAEAIEDYETMEVWERAMMHDTADEIRDVYKSADYDDSMRRKAESVASELESLERQSEAGHLYEYDIPDEMVDKMLDWDAPLGEQDSIARVVNNNWDNIPAQARLDAWQKSGGDWYRTIANEIGDKEASMLLSELDIPGIKYLDGTSRSAGEGTRNMVLFDPENTVRSVKRDGEEVFNRGLLD